MSEMHIGDLLQQAWDERCKAKGYVARRGMETRYTPDGHTYYLMPGYGRVRFDNHLGWIIVLSVQGWHEEPYQYIKTDETKWSDLGIIMDMAAADADGGAVPGAGEGE